MYRVLAPIDSDEPRTRAQIEAIRDLPEAAESVRVDLLHVHEEIDAPGDEAGTSYIRELNERIEDLQGTPDTVGIAVEELENAGIEAEIHDITGEPVSAILEVAEEFDVDAIVVGTRSQTPVGKVVFGSVAQGVIIDSDRPVLVATP
ncbi:universal stress protein [Natronorubrum daqingense]|uniref:Nucleotide-binding universal stress protein, UspA family n=1 Tax=Natronorubrum daqingense TaxID=588898 RepID=A0A1N7F384_9EURY|nr:universal stress protein [Natronorubrum daqingense]APX97507.1 universal stress protein UspA [Natronorubrum daqingense]SIR94840.1 Nucleotide-binding universal stress protein, UspA family [Natronorubrum daqingense]